MAGPSLQNLSSYQPSRDIFADATGIARNFNAGLGDANLSTALDVVEGIDKGLDLATKANAFIESISPRAEEEKQLNLEIKRAQASVQQQAGQAAQIEMQKDALTKENQLMKAQLESEMEVRKLKTESQQVALAQTAVGALNQINDPASFLSTVNDPRYVTLRTFDPYNKHVSGQALALLNQTTDPVTQAQLLKVAEMAVPKSTDSIIKFLPPETQKLISDPKELAQIDLATAQAQKAKAEAGQIIDAGKAQAAAVAQGPRDPIAEALANAGVGPNGDAVAPQPSGMRDSATGAPNVAPAPGAPGGQVAPVQQVSDAVPQAGQQEQAEGTGAPLNPQQQVQFDQVKEKIKIDDQKKAVIDKIRATPGTPGERKFDALLKENIRQFPNLDDSARVAVVKAQVEMTDLKPKEAEELGKFREAANNMEISQMRMQAAFKTIDDFITKHGDSNLGPTDKIDRARIMAVASTVGSSEEQKALVSAWAELDAQGLRNALTELASMKLGQTAIMMNTPQEVEAQQAMYTGENISYERNKQAFDIQTAKAKQAKGIIAILDATQILGRSYNDGVQIADRWRQQNNPLDVGQVNGVPVVQLKDPNRLTSAEAHVYDAMRLDNYMQRNQEGRVIPSKPADIYNFSKDLSDKLDRGEEIPVPKASDISDRMSVASPALILRTISQESTFDSKAVSSAGAQGLMQLMPETGKELWDDFGFEGEYDPFNKEKNLVMGTTYLNQQLKDFGGDTRLALAAYNAGPNRKGLKDIKELVKAYDKAELKLGRTDYNAVQHYLPKETKDYVKRIMGDGQPLERGSLTEFEARGAYSSLPTQKAQSYAQTNLSSEGVAALEETNKINRVSDTKGTVLEDVTSALLALNPFRAAETAQAEELPAEEVGSDDSRTRVLNPDGSVSTEGQSPADALASTFQGMLGVRVENADGTPYQTQSEIIKSLEESFPTTVSNSTEFEKLRDEIYKLPDSAQKRELIKKLAYTPRDPNLEDIDRAKIGDIQAGADSVVRNLKPLPNEGSFLGELNPFRGPEDAQAVTPEERGNAALAKIDAARKKPKATTAQAKEESNFDLPDGLQAVALGAARGLFFGGDDEVFALARMAIHGETWDQATEQTRKIRDTLQEAHPWAYNIANVAGGVLSPIPGALFKGGASVLRAAKNVTGIGKVAQSGNSISQATKVSEAAKAAQTSTLGGTIGKSAGTGAAFGGLTGFFEGEGSAEGDSGDELENRLNRGLQGAVFGGVVGAALGPLVYKMVKGAGNFAPEERAILKNMIGMSDKQLKQHIDELATSGNPAGSVLAKMGVAKLKPYIDAIAKNPNSSADVINMAEENVGGQFARVASSIGQTKSSETAAKELAAMVERKIKSFHLERKALGKKAYGPAEEFALDQARQSKIKPTRSKFAEPVEFEPEMIVDAQGRTVPTAVPKQKYTQPYIRNDDPVPAFGSPGVKKAMENRTTDEAIQEAHIELHDKQFTLPDNEFSVVQRAKQILQRKAKEGDHLAGQAAEELTAAVYKENPLLEAADQEFAKYMKVFDQKYSKGIQKLETYASPEGVLDITTIHDDLMKLGPDELQSLMKNMNPAEQEAVRESIRSHITDILKARGPRRVGEDTQKFPNFLKDMGDEKIAAVMGNQEGARISKMLQEEADISSIANRLIKALPGAEKQFEKQVQRYEDLSKSDQTKFGASIAMMGVWGANQYTSAISLGFGLKALHSYVRSKKYANTSELAEGIAERLYLNPKAGLEFLEKVSNSVKTELPDYYPTWQKAVATAAQMIVSGGDEAEPQTTARKHREATEITIAGPGKRVSKEELEKEARENPIPK